MLCKLSKQLNLSDRLLLWLLLSILLWHLLQSKWKWMLRSLQDSLWSLLRNLSPLLASKFYGLSCEASEHERILHRNSTLFQNWIRLTLLSEQLPCICVFPILAHYLSTCCGIWNRLPCRSLLWENEPSVRLIFITSILILFYHQQKLSNWKGLYLKWSWSLCLDGFLFTIHLKQIFRATIWYIYIKIF